jgi:D-proline reductase (dithiol) PrdB
VSLTARHLEENGIPTVVFGAARDIVEQAGVPRFVFTDFPLGNPCGAPFDREMQRTILGIGLDLLESARYPASTVKTPFAWPNDAWRANYMRVDETALEDLRKAGEERKARQAARKAQFGE